MPKIIESIYNIRFLDELASKKTLIHGLNPVAKLIVTIIYLVIVLSFGKYDITGLLPFVFYPIIIFTLSEIPFLKVFKRSIVALPLVIGMGVFNPLLDKEAYVMILGFPISAGWISFAALIIKCSLTVLAGLLLIVTTGIERVASAFRILFVPRVIVTQLLLTYRYISVLLEEVAGVMKAYSLRAPMDRGVSFKAAGSLLGQMLLRAFDRANRVYNSMILRGFSGEYTFGIDNGISKGSIIYLFLWITFFITARLFNIPETLEKILMGVLR